MKLTEIDFSLCSFRTILKWTVLNLMLLLSSKNSISNFIVALNAAQTNRNEYQSCAIHLYCHGNQSEWRKEKLKILWKIDSLFQNEMKWLENARFMNDGRETQMVKKKPTHVQWKKMLLFIAYELNRCWTRCWANWDWAKNGNREWPIWKSDLW